MKKNKKPTSKKMLICDYLIMLFLILVLLGVLCVNFLYTRQITSNLIEIGAYDYIQSITPPIDINIITTIVSVWAGQLGISTATYYYMCKSDHKSEAVERIYNDLSEEAKANLDMTSLITEVISNN